MTTTQTDYSSEELLATDDIDEPLIAGGIRCHGGFDGDGRYVSPRNRNRSIAIEAWQDKHRRDFAAEPIDIPLETWPEPFPNLPQSRFLLDRGIRDPLAAILTRIGTIEGFGAFIRDAALDGMERFFQEDLDGTATAHLGRGLFEAHGLDEAGSGDEGGHKQMWFAVRDIAFEDPFSEDQTALILEHMGIARPGSGGTVDLAAMRKEALANRQWPADIAFDLESLLARMVRILLIEIQAFHTFAWAEALLGDGTRLAGDGRAGQLVSYIRQDEAPHVGYLRTALTEMRDRTVRGESGRRYPGNDLVRSLFEAGIEQSLGSGRVQGLDFALGQIERHLDGRRDRSEILDEFHSLGSVRPDAEGCWVSSSDGRPIGRSHRSEAIRTY